jgi:hypothetical protein
MVFANADICVFGGGAAHAARHRFFLNLINHRSDRCQNQL